MQWNKKMILSYILSIDNLIHINYNINHLNKHILRVQVNFTAKWYAKVYGNQKYKYIQSVWDYKKEYISLINSYMLKSNLN